MGKNVDGPLRPRLHGGEWETIAAKYFFPGMRYLHTEEELFAYLKKHPNARICSLRYYTHLSSAALARISITNYNSTVYQLAQKHLDKDGAPG